MRRKGRKTMKALRLTVAALVASALLAGCTDNRSTFFVRDIKIPDEDDCFVQSDRNTPYRPFGMMDVAFIGGYYLHPLVENAMTSSTKLSPTTAESNRIAVTGAEVRLSLEDGTPIGDSAFFVATSALVEPGGVVATSFEGIPSAYVGGIPAGSVVLVEFRMLGTTGGGNEVDTPWFTFPVYTCDGCLTYFPPEAWDDENMCYDCCDLGSGGAINFPCNMGQDELVDCRICSYSHGALCQDPRCPCS
jgi:hypothetical protein